MPDLPVASDKQYPVATGQRLVLVLVGIVTLVTLLKIGQPVVVPIILAVITAFVLDPIVTKLERLHLSRPLGGALAVLLVIGSLAFSAYVLRQRVIDFVDAMPGTAEKLRGRLRAMPNDRNKGVLGRIKEAARQIDETVAVAADSTGKAAPPSRGVQRVEVQEPKFDAEQMLWDGSMALAILSGQAAVVIFLAYFLLATGDLYKRKLVRLLGHSFAERRVTAETLSTIRFQIERFLLVQVLTCGAVGFASWLAFEWLGLEAALMWGIICGVLNLIPYFGSIAGTLAVGVTAFLQFGTFHETALITFAAFLITTLEGYLLTPWLMGHYSGINNVAIFVSLLFWGWMWGVTGMFLAVPMMMIVKNICEHVEGLEAIGELLNER